jgi:hypothetical protein
MVIPGSGAILQSNGSVSSLKLRNEDGREQVFKP